MRTFGNWDCLQRYKGVFSRFITIVKIVYVCNDNVAMFLPLAPIKIFRLNRPTRRDACAISAHNQVCYTWDIFTNKTRSAICHFSWQEQAPAFPGLGAERGSLGQSWLWAVPHWVSGCHRLYTFLKQDKADFHRTTWLMVLDGMSIKSWTNAFIEWSKFVVNRTTSITINRAITCTTDKEYLTL